MSDGYSFGKADQKQPIESKTFSSSLVDQAQYDPNTQTLEVTLNSGRSYTVQAFSPAEWSAFQNAWSAGRFFNDVIRHREV